MKLFSCTRSWTSNELKIKLNVSVSVRTDSVSFVVGEHDSDHDKTSGLPSGHYWNLGCWVDHSRWRWRSAKSQASKKTFSKKRRKSSKSWKKIFFKKRRKSLKPRKKLFSEKHRKSLKLLKKRFPKNSRKSLEIYIIDFLESSKIS